MEKVSTQREVVTALSVDLVEELYGKQENTEQLLELMRLEFPEENFTLDDIYDAAMLPAEIEDLEILYNQLGY